MNAIQTFAAWGLLLSGLAYAAPNYNGTVKGTVDGKPIDVKVVCEVSNMGKSDWLMVTSDPGMGALTDRNGDGVAVSVNADLAQSGAAFMVRLADQTYKFGKLKGLKVSSKGLTIKDNFAPMKKDSKPKGFDVDLTVRCP